MHKSFSYCWALSWWIWQDLWTVHLTSTLHTPLNLCKESHYTTTSKWKLFLVGVQLALLFWQRGGGGGGVQGLLSGKGWVWNLTVWFCVKNNEKNVQRSEIVNELLQSNNGICQSVLRTQVHSINLSFTQNCTAQWVSAADFGSHGFVFM